VGDSGDRDGTHAAATSTTRRGIHVTRIAATLGDLRLGRFSGIYLWLIFVALFAIWIPGTFLKVATAQSVAQEEAITLVLGLGALVSMSAGQFDLSLASNLGFGTCLCIKLVAAGHVPGVEAAVITILACGAVGALNAAVVVGAGIDSFIATLGTSSVILALTEIVAGELYVGPVHQGFSTFVTWQPLGVPVLALYALMAAVVVWYVLEHTPVGRRVYATGANPDTARLSGIPIRRYKIGSLVICGLVAGLAAVLEAAEIQTANASVGSSFLLPTFAAVFLSATQVKPGRFNVWGMVVAIVLIATGEKGLELAGLPLWITDMFDGVALLLAVGTSLYFQRRRTTRATRRVRARAGAEPAGDAPQSSSGAEL
jgi:ribose transport system permease protein